MECVRVILMTSFFSDEINLKMTANNDNRLRGSLPEIITKRIVGECSSSVTDSRSILCSAVIASATDMYTDSTVSSHYQYNLV